MNRNDLRKIPIRIYDAEENAWIFGCPETPSIIGISGVTKTLSDLWKDKDLCHKIFLDPKTETRYDFQYYTGRKSGSKLRIYTGDLLLWYQDKNNYCFGEAVIDEFGNPKMLMDEAIGGIDDINENCYVVGNVYDGYYENISIAFGDATYIGATQEIREV